MKCRVLFWVECAKTYELACDISESACEINFKFELLHKIIEINWKAMSQNIAVEATPRLRTKKKVVEWAYSVYITEPEVGTWLKKKDFGFHSFKDKNNLNSSLPSDSKESTQIFKNTS